MTSAIDKFDNEILNIISCAVGGGGVIVCNRGGLIVCWLCKPIELL